MWCPFSPLLLHVIYVRPTSVDGPFCPHTGSVIIPSDSDSHFVESAMRCWPFSLRVSFAMHRHPRHLHCQSE